MWLPHWLLPDARAELLAAGIWQWLALSWRPSRGAHGAAPRRRLVPKSRNTSGQALVTPTTRALALAAAACRVAMRAGALPPDALLAAAGCGASVAWFAARGLAGSVVRGLQTATPDGWLVLALRGSTVVLQSMP
jgi:hypothetical protein